MGSAGPGESDRDNNGNSCKHSDGACSRPAAAGPRSNSTVSWKIKLSRSLMTSLLQRFLDCFSGSSWLRAQNGNPDSISQGVFAGCYGIKWQKVRGISDSPSQTSNASASSFRIKLESWILSSGFIASPQRKGSVWAGWGGRAWPNGFPGRISVPTGNDGVEP